MWDGRIRTVRAMLSTAHTVAFARVAAVLVAATLTGAPRVLAMHAPVEGHRCACRTHGAGRQHCECALCRKESGSAHRSGEPAPEPGRPRCHPAAQRANEPGERRPLQDAPCIEGTCGAVGHAATAPAGAEPFCLAAGKLPRLVERVEARAGAEERARALPLEPETPPPRAA
jgi:hypothetical protein